MPSSSTHQDSPKVPEKLMEEMVNRFVWAATTGPHHPDATPEKAVETIIAPLLSALLSDEVVEAVAKAGRPMWQAYKDASKDQAICQTRAALTAAIEQVRGPK